MFFAVLGGLALVFCIVCNIIILIGAFMDEVWKGLLGLVCSLYLVYYSIFEFQSNNKGLIVAGYLGGGLLASIFFHLSGYGHVPVGGP